MQWKPFLDRFFSGRVKDVKKFHLFRFSKDHPGFVFCYERHDDKESVKVRLVRPDRNGRTPLAELRSVWERGERPAKTPIPSISDHIIRTTEAKGADGKAVVKTMNRLEYLQKEVIRPLKAAHPDIETTYFEDGSKAVQREPNYYGSPPPSEHPPPPPPPPLLPPVSNAVAEASWVAEPTQHAPQTTSDAARGPGSAIPAPPPPTALQDPPGPFSEQQHEPPITHDSNVPTLH